jgi:AraC-like DNA-binding protein
MLSLDRFNVTNMQMRLQHFEPDPQLYGYVSKIWVFESSGRVPYEDMKLIVPNGMVKITIPFRNGVSGRNKEAYHLSKESRITLIGISDIPAVVDIEHDAPSGNIGIEFSALGAYRILQLRLSELKNKIFLLEDAFGKPARDVQEMIANTESIPGKIALIQKYLIRLLAKSEPDRILDYCITQIKSTKGMVTVNDLEAKTGYTRRWLYDKFTEKVGISAKNYSSIVRFMQFYERWAKTGDYRYTKDNLYQYFFDQAHFIKEFKRFTGFSPLRFAKSENEFGRIFYKE